MEEHCCICDCYQPAWRTLSYYLAIAVPTGAAVYYWCKKRECEKKFEDYKDLREFVEYDAPPSPRKVKMNGEVHAGGPPSRGRSPNARLRAVPSQQFPSAQSQSQGMYNPNGETDLDQSKITQAISCLTKTLKCANSRLSETERAISLIERQLEVLVQDCELIKGQLGIQNRGRRSPNNNY